ncbi:interferon regulatory factor 4-like isoform X2 [Clavelina lepadiformis]|uniref:interferon regulatory factor 4-like isoform X2 n=1 Tax=Clavelina lepadiformis TaxID=159417 RepID=UPI0040430682
MPYFDHIDAGPLSAYPDSHLMYVTASALRKTMSEEEFKLPLRQWLKNKLDKNDQEKFPGLQWVNKETQTFKIPWTQKGHPDWEAHYEIFKAWAIHRGSTDEGKLKDFKKLKGNFRCAMNKSDDFQELKEKSQTGKQTGNYKLYKLLTPEEVKQKVKKSAKAPTSEKSRKRPRSTVSPSPQNSLGTPESKKPTEAPLVEEVFPDGENLSELLGFDSDTLNNAFLDFDRQQVDGEFRSFLQSTPPVAPEMNTLQVASPLPIDRNSFAEAPISYHSAMVETQYQTEEHTLCAQEILVSPPPATSPDVQFVSLQSSQPSALYCESLQAFLDKFQVSSQQLPRFQITWRYGKMIAGQETLDLNGGYRLLCGNPDIQKAMADVYKKKYDWFNWNTFIFPAYDRHLDNSKKSMGIQMILDKADLGILLKLDGHVLKACRLCQSQIFYLDRNEASGQSIKMEREQWYEIFSYSRYIQSLIKGKNADSEITLIIGTRPGQPTLVTVSVEPSISAVLKENFSSNANPSLLAMSQQTSLEEIIRMLDGFDTRLR